MLRDTANSERAKVAQSDARRNSDSDTACEGASAGSTGMDLGLVPQRTLEEYRRECAGQINVKRFSAMAEDAENLVGYDRNCFKHDTELGG